MKKLLIIFFLWILLINIFAVFALNRFNLEADTAYHWMGLAKFQQVQRWSPVPLHAKWDSSWYLGIAQNGYSFQGPEKLSNIVFFPLYPFLIRLTSFLTMGNLILAGWILSCIFLFFALVFLFKLVKEFHKPINPYLPVLFLLIFPTAFFLNAVYTESLFIFLSLAVFYYCLKKKFLWAGLFGFFAALTRVTGILLFIPLLWEYLKIYNFNFIRSLRLRVLPLILVPIGTLSFFLYHYFKFGDFFLFFKVESWWGRAFKLNLSHFSLFSNPAIVNFCLDVLMVIFVLVVIFFVFKNLRISYGLYMLATIVVALGTGTLMSIGRYILVLFPIYILAGSIKNQYLQRAWIFSSILLLAMNVTLFVNNYWAG